LVGAAFILAGFRSISGTAKNTHAYGIGSIILGVPMVLGGILFGLIAVVEYVQYVQGGAGHFGQHSFVGPFGFAVAGIFLPVGAGLLLAGVLAIKGRDQYQAWRRARTAASG
jgi:uncharacterized membrane protein